MSCEYADVITAISDVIVALSAAAAAIFAYVGLSTWRKQLKGGAEYQLAKDVLKAVYRVREAFKSVRNPAIYEYEYPEEMLSPSGHLREEKKYEGTAHVYLQAQVEWGTEFQNRIEKLRYCRVELMSAIQDLLEGYKNPEARATTPPQESRRARSVLYLGGGTEFDRFTPQIDEAIDEFERWLRPKVSE